MPQNIKNNPNPQAVYDLFLKSYKKQISELKGNLAHLQIDQIQKAIQLILNCEGKLVVTGMGKSGLIGQKMAATFSSTGTPSFFLHPGESLHGDLGCLQKNDIMMVIAKSGESEEVTSMLRVVRNMKIPIIAVLGKPDSTAGEMADVIIRASVASEADPLNLAPTASTTVALVVGDALAAVVSELRGFDADHFALFHPAGQLGKRLLLKVDDLLKNDQGIPILHVSASIPELLEAENGPNLGGVMIVDDANKLIGIITDGDLRRAILKYDSIRDCSIEDIMTHNPIAIHKGTMAIQALRLMQNRKSQISVIPVIDEMQKPIGLIRMHDLIGAGL